jgi:hypothetical protein
MTKEDFFALADALRIHNRTADGRTEFTPDHLRVLADFCASQCPDLNRERWIECVAGECGQGDEWIFVEPDSNHIPGATTEDKPVPGGNRNSSIPIGEVESLKPRQLPFK